MTKEQIQALIDAKIAGQGSAVDAGGALPTILSEILALAESAKDSARMAAKLFIFPKVLPKETATYTPEEMAEYGFSLDTFIDFVNGKYFAARINVGDEESPEYEFFQVYNCYWNGESDNYLVLGRPDTNYEISFDGSEFYVQWTEE